MPWNVKYDSELGIILCIYAGKITADDFKKGTEKIISSAKKHKTNLLLIDDSKLEASVSTTEIYQMPQFYDEVKGNRKSRIALILPPSGQIRKDVKFYETVCRNHGWDVKAFDKRRDATDWLIQKDTSNKPDASGGK